MADNIYTSGEYAVRNQTFHIEDSAWKADQIYGMIAKHALRPQTVCEVGCGAGEVLRQMQIRLPSEAKFAGYEISPQAYQLSVARTNRHLSFYNQDLLATDLLPFDLMLCIDVFEHVDDYIGFVHKLHSKGRNFIFHIPLRNFSPDAPALTPNTVSA